MTVVANPITAFGSNWRSAQHRRMLAALLAAIGCGLSFYLAAYQYGRISHVWEPFFGNGSELVLNSGLLDSASQFVGFTIHDAAIGMIGYFIEAGIGLALVFPRMASARWLTPSYLVLVAIMGATGLILVLVQIFTVQAACSLCLISAVLSELIVALAVPEFIGLLDYKDSVRRPTIQTRES